MTSMEAKRLAAERFGEPSFAKTISSKDRHKRFVVGIVGPGTGEPLPLGIGETYEAAFHDATLRGFTPEKLNEIRDLMAAKLKEVETNKYEARANAFVNSCVERLTREHLGPDSPEFRAEARAYFDKMEAERADRPPLPSPEEVAREYAQPNWTEQHLLGRIAIRKTLVSGGILQMLGLGDGGAKN